MKKSSSDKNKAQPDVPPRSPGLTEPPVDALFSRVAVILEQSRANVVRAVNHNMVVAYWLIGREIVMELQRGKERAGYGSHLLKELSDGLMKAFGKGYSVENLRIFRQFYLTFTVVGRIQYPVGTELGLTASEPQNEAIAVPSFLPQLSWSQYRALMRVENTKARDYYEKEAASAGWSKRELERQIHTHCYDRLIATQKRRDTLQEPGALIHPQSVTPAGLVVAHPLDALKDPYVLEFLDIPEPATLHESGLEGAIIVHLRDFLLELGKGFAFVARQKRLPFDGDNLYVDLVFYNCLLKCYLLIDLKMGRLTPGDVGQMDSYVRMFDDLVAAPDDNPTIGLILCTDHNNAVARYSVLSDSRQIFASRYVTCLPTEAELAAEIQRSRALIENGAAGQD